LAYGFQGGVAAYRNHAAEDDPATTEDIERFKRTWRDAHPQTVAFWHQLNRCAIAAMGRPGAEIDCGRLTLCYDGETFLRIRLPSGRSIAYPFQRLENKIDPFGRPQRVVIFKDTAYHQWADCRQGEGFYGGAWAENVTQAVARDLLAAAMVSA
jgi:DNA polymerase